MCYLFWEQNERLQHFFFKHPCQPLQDAALGNRCWWTFYFTVLQILLRTDLSYLSWHSYYRKHNLSSEGFIRSSSNSQTTYTVQENRKHVKEWNCYLNANILYHKYPLFRQHMEILINVTSFDCQSNQWQLRKTSTKFKNTFDYFIAIWSNRKSACKRICFTNIAQCCFSKFWFQRILLFYHSLVSHYLRLGDLETWTHIS